MRAQRRAVERGSTAPSPARSGPARPGEHPELVAHLVEEPVPRVGVGRAERRGSCAPRRSPGSRARRCRGPAGWSTRSRRSTGSSRRPAGRARASGRRRTSTRRRTPSGSARRPRDAAAASSAPPTPGLRRGVFIGWSRPSVHTTLLARIAGRGRARWFLPGSAPAPRRRSASARCRRRAARPGRAGGPAPARRRPRSRRRPRCWPRCTTSSPRSPAYAESSRSPVPSVRGVVDHDDRGRAMGLRRRRPRATPGGARAGSRSPRPRRRGACWASCWASGEEAIRRARAEP